MPDSLLQESLFPALLASLPPLASLHDDSRLITPIALNSRLKFLSDDDRGLMKDLRDTLQQVNLGTANSSLTLRRLILRLKERSRDVAMLLDFLRWYQELLLSIGNMRKKLLIDTPNDKQSDSTPDVANLNLGNIDDLFSLNDFRLGTTDIDMLKSSLTGQQVNKIHHWLLQTAWKHLSSYPNEQMSDLSQLGFYIIRWHLAHEARDKDCEQAYDYLNLVSDEILNAAPQYMSFVQRGSKYGSS